MEENYQEKRVLKDLMNKNRDVARALVSGDKQDKVLEIMIEKKITNARDLSGRKKEEVLKAINNKVGIGGYETRKAFQAALGTAKSEQAKIKSNSRGGYAGGQTRYEKMVEKRKNNVQGEFVREQPKSSIFSVKLRPFQPFEEKRQENPSIKAEKVNKLERKPQYEETIAVLKRIQARD